MWQETLNNTSHINNNKNNHLDNYEQLIHYETHENELILLHEMSCEEKTTEDVRFYIYLLMDIIVNNNTGMKTGQEWKRWEG